MKMRHGSQLWSLIFDLGLMTFCYPFILDLLWCYSWQYGLRPNIHTWAHAPLWALSWSRSKPKNPVSTYQSYKHSTRPSHNKVACTTQTRCLPFAQTRVGPEMGRMLRHKLGRTSCSMVSGNYRHPCYIHVLGTLFLSSHQPRFLTPIVIHNILKILTYWLLNIIDHSLSVVFILNLWAK